MVARAGMKWYLLIVTILMMFLLLADPALTPLMIPSISKELSLNKTAAIWIINAYYIAFAAFLLIGGRLCELIGYRNLYKGGALLFAIGAFIVGTSDDYYLLIMGRVIQGIGAGMNLPVLAAMIIASFPKGERGRALAIDSGVASFLVLLSVFFSGFIIQWFSWRMIYLSFIFFALLGLVLSLVIVKSSPIKWIRFPLFTPIILILGMIFSISSIMEAGRHGWGNPLVVVGLIAGAVLLVTFVIASIYYSKEPLADFRLFSEPTFFWVNWVRTIVFILLAASNLWVIYFGSNLGLPPAKLGVLIFVAQLPALLTALIGGYISDHYSFRLSFLLGFVLMISSFSWFCIFYETHNAWALLPGLFCFTGASPILISQTTALGLSCVPQDQLGSMSGLMTTIAQFGQAIGLAVLLALFLNVETTTKNDALAFFSLNAVCLGLSILGLMITLTKISPKKLSE